jgi:hypothetical protein
MCLQLKQIPLHTIYKGTAIDKLPLVPKIKLIGNGEFTHLTNTLTLPIMCEPRLPLNK